MLNARYHEQEAHIIAQAGVPGTVTIATNMAGRGTDIQLGGNARYRIRDWIKEEIDARPAAQTRRIDERLLPSGSTTASASSPRAVVRAIAARAGSRPRWSRVEEPSSSGRASPEGARGAEAGGGRQGEDGRASASRSNASSPRSSPTSEAKKKALDAGGLYVIGTERHESRRIDNQLRGRSGRQGDPGRSKFYLSLEDDLMRIFGSDRMDGVLQDARPAGRRGDHPSLDQQGAGEGAEEGRGAQLRHPQAVLKYDDVMNDQRKVIFEQRIDIMGRRRRQRDGQRTCATRS